MRDGGDGAPIGGEAALAGIVMAVGAGAAAVAWLASRGACAVSGCTVRAGVVRGVLGLMIGRSAERAWGAPGMSGPVFWTLAVLLAGALVAAAVAAVARVRGRLGRLRPAGGRGLAAGADVRRCYSAAALEKMVWLRPDLARPRARDMGVMIGRAGREGVWVACEDSMILTSPSRQGKTRFFIIPIVLSWAGPVVVTSVRAELAAATLAARRARGPVAVFAPTTVGGAVGGAGVLRWSLIDGCADPTVALRRARALVANAAAGTENSDFWQANAHSALAALLCAAALSGAGVDELARWCADPGQARTAVTILKSSAPSAAWGAQLEGQLGGDERTVSNIWATINSCVALPLMDPAVRSALSPSPDERLDIGSFLAASGTLYIVGDATAASAPIVAALVEEVYAVAQERANASPANRLVPPLALVLDELNNIAELPSLPTMMSAGGGSNILTCVVEQSRAQSESRWGARVAASIWDSATVKVLLGGITRQATLTEVSAALGERTVRRATTSVGRGPASTSLAETREAVLTAGQVHALARGRALVIKAGAPAVIMDCLDPSDRPARAGRSSQLGRRAPGGRGR